MEYTAQPLPLEGSRNTRDLGGYQTADGQTTRFHRFLRSDALSSLSEADRSVLLAYGLCCAIDLRSEVEHQNFPAALRSCPEVEFVTVPLSDGVNDKSGVLPRGMGEMYTGLLDRAGAALSQVYRAALRHPEGCVLFNCTAGKDRTGTVAMLLLKLAGVPDEDVVRDYAATERYARPWRESQAELEQYLHIRVPEHVFRSQPENMRQALAHLQTVYGGAEPYLRHIGLSGAETAALRRMLVD